MQPRRGRRCTVIHRRGSQGYPDRQVCIILVGRHAMVRNISKLLILVACSFTSCSRVFVVEPAGSLGTGIRFEFHEVSGERASFRIQEFNLYSREPDGRAAPIWSLSGLARVDEIRYGVAPSGLSGAKPAAPLAQGGVYFVSARDMPRVSAPGHAGVLFAIVSGGGPKECDSLAECFSLARGR